MRRDVHDYIRDHNLNDLITLESFTDHETVVEHLRRVDVALLVSFNRSLPYKVVEYVGARLPIVGVVSDESVLKPIVSGEEAVSLHNRTNAEGFKRKLAKWVVNQPKLSDGRLRDQFSLRRIVRHLDQLYRDRRSEL